LPAAGRVNVLSLPDLVQAKKTQRDKDWPMIRRLVEVDYHNRSQRPSRAQKHFWLSEARTPELLIEIARRYPTLTIAVQPTRPLIQYALDGDAERLAEALIIEEQAIRAADRRWWQPLREELLVLRRQARTARKKT
jgi:hypothetical protein